MTSQDLWEEKETKGKHKHTKTKNLPLWLSPRTTENTQAARRNGAGPGRQFCRQTNAAVKKARAERHIMQSSPHRVLQLAALRVRACASRAHLGARGPSVARTFPGGLAGGPRDSEQAVQVRWPGHRSAFQGPLALQARHRGSRNLREKHLLRRPMAWGGDASDGSAARSGTKKRAFVSPQPMGILLHKSA